VIARRWTVVGHITGTPWPTSRCAFWLYRNAQQHLNTMRTKAGGQITYHLEDIHAERAKKGADL
jgi:hypothetical protein